MEREKDDEADRDLDRAASREGVVGDERHHRQRGRRQGLGDQPPRLGPDHEHQRDPHGHQCRQPVPVVERIGEPVPGVRRNVRSCWPGTRRARSAKAGREQPTTAIAAPTARTVRRSASRSCAARESASTPTKMRTRPTSSTLRSLLADHEMPSAVQAANASSRPRPTSSARPRAPHRQRADERAEQHDPPDRDSHLAADDDVVAAALQREVEDEHERAERCWRGSGQVARASSASSASVGSRASAPSPVRCTRSLGRLRHRNDDTQSGLDPDVVSLGEPIRMKR